MSDQFTNITTIGYGNRIMNALKGVIIGSLLFAVSFGVLYWNEGRVDLSKIAKTATEITSTAVSTDATLNEKLISTTGNVNSDQTIGDNLFLNPGQFVAVERKVEMYSWIEKSESHSQENTGGSETTKTTYTYSKDWTEDPEPSNKFKHPEGHENMQKALDGATYKASVATIGVYNFDVQSINLPNFSQFSLNSQNVTLTDGAVLMNDNYIFIKKSADGTFSNPQIGDLRISYYTLSSGFKGTVFGKLSGSTIGLYSDQKGTNLYHLFIGTREQGIATLHTEYMTLLWILRLVGFLLMWFGLMGLFGPISVVLAILPIFGEISRMITGFVTFVTALVLTLVTIIVSMILHSFVALIITLFIIVGITIIFLVMWRNKKKAVGVMSNVTDPASLPINQELENYVREAQAKGMMNDQIRQELLTAGWSSDAINQVLG